MAGISIYHDNLATRLVSLAELAFACAGCTLNASLKRDIINHILPSAQGDLAAMIKGDPSIRNKPVECLMSVNSTFFAVLSYRLAHRLVSLGQQNEDHTVDAMRLSYAARSSTGVDIHPEARIGARFVVDHGWGTVIGQTVEIGDDNYILNNVTLGGRLIANAAQGKRHPTLGDRVQLSAGVRILGPVTIGDDCFIGPDVTVVTDLEAGKRVVVRRDYHVQPNRGTDANVSLLRACAHD